MIIKYNYTFNYSGNKSSFEEPFNGLVKVLNRTSKEIPVELIFPRESILTNAQKGKINRAFITHDRKPYFDNKDDDTDNLEGSLLIGF